MSRELVDDLHLVSVTRADFGGDPCWAVTLSLFRNEGNPQLSVTYHLPRSSFDESDVVRAARHYFHELMVMLSQQTQKWSLSETDLDALFQSTKDRS